MTQWIKDSFPAFMLILSSALAGAWLDEYFADEPKETMCQITQHEQVSVMPCRILSEYLAVVDFK